MVVVFLVYHYSSTLKVYLTNSFLLLNFDISLLLITSIKGLLGLNPGYKVFDTLMIIPERFKKL